MNKIIENCVIYHLFYFQKKLYVLTKYEILFIKKNDEWKYKNNEKNNEKIIFKKLIIENRNYSYTFIHDINDDILKIINIKNINNINE